MYYIKTKTMRTLIIAFFIICCLQSNAQLTLIPDSNFEQVLINLGLDNAPINGSVPTANIDTLTILNVSNQNITNLTGIEDFTSLIGLDCQSNYLTSIDLTNNQNLTWLNCQYNLLTSLNVSANKKLTSLLCGVNQLTNIDVSNNDTLYFFWCDFNQLTTIDISNNNYLNWFNCRNNQINSILFPSNHHLFIVDCQYNNLMSLNIPDTSLTQLSCYDNSLTSLNTSQNKNLGTLLCFNNQLTNLDLSQNSLIQTLHCDNNQLECLNMKNGNNPYINDFTTYGNPNLICIQVDNYSYSNTNWTDIDPTSSYSTNCNYNCTVGISKNELSYSDISIYPNPSNGVFFIDIEKDIKFEYDIYNLMGKKIDSGVNKKEVNLTKQPQGIYIINILMEGQYINKRLIKN